MEWPFIISAISVKVSGYLFPFHEMCYNINLWRVVILKYHSFQDVI